MNRLWNLQNWYPEILANARVHVPNVEQSFLDTWRYKRVVAKSMHGFPREVVIVDQGEFDRLDSRARAELLEEL
ncbi:MAG: hypothetical protein ABSF08_07905 [Candidatus Cybelea sp.]